RLGQRDQRLQRFAPIGIHGVKCTMRADFECLSFNLSRLLAQRRGGISGGAATADLCTLCVVLTFASLPDRRSLAVCAARYKLASLECLCPRASSALPATRPTPKDGGAVPTAATTRSD